MIPKIIILFTHLFSHLGDTPVIVAIFKGLGDRFTLTFIGKITYFFIILQPQFIEFGTVFYCFVSFLQIIIANTFDIGICDNGNRVVTEHIIGIISGKGPHWKSSSVIVDLQQRFDKIGGPLLIDNREKRM